MRRNRQKLKKLHVFKRKLPKQRKRLTIIKDLLYRRIKGSDISQLMIPKYASREYENLSIVWGTKKELEC